MFLFFLFLFQVRITFPMSRFIKLQRELSGYRVSWIFFFNHIVYKYIMYQRNAFFFGIGSTKFFRVSVERVIIWFLHIWEWQFLRYTYPWSDDFCLFFYVWLYTEKYSLTRFLRLTWSPCKPQRAEYQLLHRFEYTIPMWNRQGLINKFTNWTLTNLIRRQILLRILFLKTYEDFK